MTNKNAVFTMVLAVSALIIVLLVENFLVPPGRVAPIEPEETVGPEETVEPDEPEKPIIIVPVEPVEEPAPPIPPEQQGRPYNPLYQYGYGEPNDLASLPEEPIEPEKRLLKDGWIIMIDPDGVPEPVERNRRKALEDEWKHRV